MKPVYLKYLDAAIYEDPHRPDHAFSPMVMEAVGWLVRSGKETTVIAYELDEGGRVRHTLAIPRANVKELRLLGKARTISKDQPNEKQTQNRKRRRSRPRRPHRP